MPVLNQAQQHDADAMRAWVAGDAQAFDRLHAVYADRLWRFVRRSVDDEDVARELYQDVWMRVIDRRMDWRDDGRFIGWLFAIARHRLIDHHRSERRRPTIDAAVDVADDATTLATIAWEPPLNAEHCASLAQDEARLNGALNALPAAQCEAVLLHHVAGLTLNEIAEASDQPRETIKSRLRYGANTLRRLLRADDLNGASPPRVAESYRGGSNR